MAWFYFVDGRVRFPTPEGAAAWRDARVATWRGKGKVKVGDALGWITSRVIDESAPPKFRTAFFLEVTYDGPLVTIRGLIHRDDEEALEGVLDVAAKLGAKGKVLFDHAFDRRAGIRLVVSNGKTTAREGDVKMPSEVNEAIHRESISRAKRLDAAKRTAPPKAKATTVTRANAKAALARRPLALPTPKRPEPRIKRRRA